MRKLVTWLLAMLLCLCSMGPAALAEPEVPQAWANMMRAYEEEWLVGEDGAVALAMMAISGKVNMLETELDAYIVEATDNYDGDTWQVSLEHPEYPELSCVFTVSLSKKEYTEVEPRDYWERYDAHYSALQAEIEGYTAAWEERLGSPYYWWPYTEKAAFAETYGRQPGFYGGTLCGLPEEGDVSYEEALAKAKQVCITHMGADEAVLETLRVDAEFQPNEAITSATNRGRIWSILFREPELNEEGYHRIRYLVDIESPDANVVHYIEDDGTGNG